RALMKQIEDRLDLTALTVTGKTMGENLEGAVVHNDDVIRPLSNPVYHEGSLAVLRGNLCPDGAVIKPAACDAKYHIHEGPALVFDSYPEMKAAVDDENLDVTPDTVMVLRNAGPLGGPGFPEWGMLPIPKALIRQGHRDMLRISDARMSGTSYGACVLHVAPEAYIGGPLALLKTGDIVRLDLPARRLDMLVPEAEIAERRAAWTPPKPHYERGYGWMFSQHVTQADKGCDFDFLERGFGPSAGEPEIF
ncbi:MAG: dihydroxy-acid dehydratase, partial [Paracoccus sp. (in: a-proteobacteria)]